MQDSAFPPAAPAGAPMVMNAWSSKRASAAATLALCGLLAAAGVVLGCGDLPYAYIYATLPYRLIGAGVAILISAIICAGALKTRVRAIPSFIIVPAVLAAVLALQWSATAWWPNSADEYGYIFLARTLLHGRLYNPPPPVPDLFNFAWIFTRDGKWFSQYAPGFSLLLAPFLAAGIGFLCNPLLTALLAWLNLITLRALGVSQQEAACFTCLLVFSPFAMFNGAALFPHMLCAVALLAIIRAQARDEATPALRHRLAIGALFSVLLLTRYEVFAITLAIFGGALALRHRARLLHHAWPMALAGLPGAAMFMIYNTAITKRPFRTPYAWASPGAGYGFYVNGDRGVNTPMVAFERSMQWSMELLAYTSAILVLLAGIALIVKWRTRRLHYYDLMFPATLAFFFLFANTGGHRFGPRYWFFAWPTAMLTIATAWPPAQDSLRVWRLRLHLPTLTLLHLATYAGLCAAIAINFSAYVAIRRQVYAATPPQRPAVVLIPSRYIVLSNHYDRPSKLGSADFARNGVDFTAPVLYGRGDNGIDDQQRYIDRACSLPGRHVYLWQVIGGLRPVQCPASVDQR